jgi:hypothetical protein
VSDRQKLRQIEVAADAARYRLLEAAVLQKSFLAQDAERIATGAVRGSGTARSIHAKRLEAAGLLRRREDPVRYVATAAGKAVYKVLRGALNNARPTRDDSGVVVVALLQLRGDAARDAASAADDLLATLEGHLRQVPAFTRSRRGAIGPR